MEHEARRLIVILLGGPGAGKGTQAKAISSWLGFPHISTGQLIRSEIARTSALGQRARSIVEAGGLVDDKIVNAMVLERTSAADCTDGFILDGYPRDIDQAVAFRSTLSAPDRLFVIDIETDLDKVLARLTGRVTCPDCSAIYHRTSSPPRTPGICDRCGEPLMQRADDHEDVIRARFESYTRQTQPLAALFREWGIYHRVNGMQPADLVAADVNALLREKCFQPSDEPLQIL